MNDAFLADALTYLKHVEQDAVLVLRHSGGTRGKKLLDAVKAGGWPTVDCQPLKKDAEKTAFVTAEFRAAGRRITPEAVQSLVNAVGANLSELAAACSQLIADASTAVDADMVDRYYGGRVEATAFKVADAAMAGNGPVAPLHAPSRAGHRRRPGAAGGGPGGEAADSRQGRRCQGLGGADRQAVGHAAVAGGAGTAGRPEVDAGGPGTVHPGHGRSRRAGQGAIA
jgi:hypothetical protein